MCDAKQLFDFARNNLDAIVAEFDFPSHEPSRIWAWQDCIMLSYSREMYGWERSLAEKLSAPSGLFILQQHLNELVEDRLKEGWRQYLSQSVRFVAGFKRYYIDGKQFGRTILILEKPLFLERLVSDRKWGEISIRQNDLPVADEMTQSFRRILKNQLGRGAVRARCLVLDGRTIVFHAEGIFSAAQNKMIQKGGIDREAVRRTVEFGFMAAMTEVFCKDREGLTPHSDVNVRLDHDEAIGFVIL